MDDKVIVIFKKRSSDQGIDIEIPKDITAAELIYGLNQGLHLGLNIDDPIHAYMRSENPIALVRGDVTIEELGIRNGSVIIMEE